jgi:homoserine dehydrogenase
LADAALDLKFGSHHRVPPFVAHNGKVHVASIDDTISPYYVRLQVLDRPGVFARIAKVLGDADIGISSIFQPEGHVGDSVPVILMLHDAPYGVLRRALSQIRRLSAVKEPPHLIRVESLT